MIRLQCTDWSHTDYIAPWYVSFPKCLKTILFYHGFVLLGQECLWRVCVWVGQYKFSILFVSLFPIYFKNNKMKRNFISIYTEYQKEELGLPLLTVMYHTYYLIKLYTFLNFILLMRQRVVWITWNCSWYSEQICAAKNDLCNFVIR